MQRATGKMTVIPQWSRGSRRPLFTTCSPSSMCPIFLERETPFCWFRCVAGSSYIVAFNKLVGYWDGPMRLRSLAVRHQLGAPLKCIQPRRRNGRLRATDPILLHILPPPKFLFHRWAIETWTTGSVAELQFLYTANSQSASRKQRHRKFPLAARQPKLRLGPRRVFSG
jgi:hypothetical protein